MKLSISNLKFKKCGKRRKKGLKTNSVLRITFREQKEVMSGKKRLTGMLENAECVLEAGEEEESQTLGEVKGMHVYL